MNRRGLRRLIGVIAPIASVVVVLVVLHGAGVALSLPGVLAVLALLLAVRLVLGLVRRRRADRS